MIKKEITIMEAHELIQLIKTHYDISDTEDAVRACGWDEDQSFDLMLDLTKESKARTKLRCARDIVQDLVNRDLLTEGSFLIQV